MFCPLGARKCDHCSDEKRRDIQRVGILKTGLMERREREIPLGLFCNNDGKTFIKNLKVCPIPEALGVPLVCPILTELNWMRIHGEGS
jgi:hypothetical protein